MLRMPSFCPVGRSKELTPEALFIGINENFALAESCFFLRTQKVRTLENRSVSSHLLDNSSQLHSVVVKFCTQNYLINISIEFENEHNSSGIY